MSRVFLKIAYDGTDFFGWQVQPNKITVQQLIESALQKLFSNKVIRIHSSGRTDAGVHASAQTATCDLPDLPRIPNQNILQALNNLLPIAIRIIEVKMVDPMFHARFSAVGKAYTYVINSGTQTPFDARYSWGMPSFIDLNAVEDACKILQGKHDFAAFTTSRKNIDNSVREIFNIQIQKFNDFYALNFIGSGFLYKMVRNITGLLALVAQGKILPDQVQIILDSKNRASAPKEAPPNGLFLRKVFYDNDALHDFSPKSLPYGIMQ
jgi:tRNA pseudouridine38-40 synthase